MKSLIIKAAKEAGKVILKNYGNIGKLKLKGPRNIVTKADMLSEQAIIKTIRKRFPEHSFLTEESGSIGKNSRYTWIIDPIDGTTNFVSKIPSFAVSIALAENKDVVMGVVYNPYTNEMYFAEKGKGSYLNGKKLRVSGKKGFGECMLGFSLPNDIGIAKRTLSMLSKDYGTFRAIRNTGSASLNLCHVADKKYDLYFSFNVDAWDVAAAKLIVEEAGGRITNFDGEKWGISDKNIVASNGILHKKFIKLLK